MSINEGSTIAKEEALEICQEFLAGPWKDISIDDLQFDIFSGGLSNGLYYCALPKHLPNTGNEKCVPKEVLLRIFGPLQDNQDAIIREAVIFTLLSERNLGPKLFGIFQRGRLEEFIPSRSMDWNDLKIWSKAIAKEMAKIHTLQVPISKRPLLGQYVCEWLEFVEKNVKQISSPFVRQLITTGEYKRELKWLTSVIEEADSPLVFGHNDLNGGNILLTKDPLDSEGTNVRFIDFEFGAYNYRGFDIGNYFNEWCFNYHAIESPYSFEVDLSRYPTKAEQVEFIDAYLLQLHKEGAISGSVTLIELERKKILEEVASLRLASHLYWAMWSFKMGPSSTLNYPFWEHGKSRWDAYLQFKEELIRDRSQGH